MLKLLRFSCALMAMVVLSTAQKNRPEGPSCSLDELSKISARYVKRLQGIMSKVYYTSPALKDWEMSQPNFKRRLMMMGFFRMDNNRNGLIDYSEGVTKKWRLPGSSRCKLVFLKACDLDQSKSVSPQEWLDCFQIPACTESCTHGKLDVIRCECHCTMNVIQGRVMSFFGSPLRAARIFSAPQTQLASTNNSGHFSVIDSCSGSQSYTVKKDGYIPLQIEGAKQRGTPLLLIHLEDAEPPSIIVHPKSKTRLYGQSANFTCKAEGTSPIRINWYKNGKNLRRETVGRDSSLYISDVTGAEGFYTCKAVNDFGAEISDAAELKIKEPIEDTCNSTPSKHTVQLPPGCTVFSEDTLDVGRCTNEPCSSSGSGSVGCGGDEDCCCGPVETSQVAIKCGSNVKAMTMERVTKCGCTTCEKMETTIKGVVVGGSNQEPIANISIIINKRAVAKTDREGKFSFVVSNDIDRLTVTFQDPNDQYSETTTTLAFQRGQSVFYKVLLQLEDPPVEFDSTQELKLPMGHAGENALELEVPAGNLLKRDGTPFKGNATLKVSLTDPRNESDLLSAPGDFTTVDQFGSVQPLKTYGILKIKVQDKDNQQLFMADNLKLYLDADKIRLPINSSGEMAPMLWWLDEKTGRWRDMGEMIPTDPKLTRTKRASSSGRRFYIGEIQTDRISVVNIDIPWKRCYVRAQTFNIRKGSPEPVGGVTITLIGREEADQEQYYGYTRAVTNKNGIACVPAWCDSSVYLQAFERTFGLNGKANISQLIPDNDSLKDLPLDLEASIVEGDLSSSFHFTTKKTLPEGPIFSGDEFNKCLSTADNMRAIQFYSNESKVDELDNFGSKPPGHPLSWYTTDAELPEKQVKKCFVKIKTESNIDDDETAPMVYVESYTPDRKQRYGFSLKKQTPLPEENATSYDWSWKWHDASAACVEYRCSEPGKETFIRVKLLTNLCYSAEPIPRLVDVQPTGWRNVSNITYPVTDFYAPVDISDGKLGLYTGLGEAAEQHCQRGRVDGGSDVEMISDGYAVLSVDHIECGLDSWIDFLRRDSSGP